MKWILLVLLAANLTFAGYQYWVLQQPKPIAQSQVQAKFNNLAVSDVQLKQMVSSLEAKKTSPAPSVQCVTIKGLKTDNSLSVVESRLKAIEIKAESKTNNNLAKTDYQILLGPFASHDAAKAKVAEIAAVGIESYIVASGEHANTLSLGVFSNEQNASRRQAELNAMGIDAITYKNEHYTQSADLIIGSAFAQLITDSKLKSIISDVDGATFSRYNCK